MRWSGQSKRLVLCGGIAALSTAALCLFYPAAWGGYIAWSVARIGLPLFGLCVGTMVAGLVLVFFSRYRHKPEMLAAALAVSAALHLLLVSFMSLWSMGLDTPRRAGSEMRFELALGLPSVSEDTISQAMREALLKPLPRDAKELDTEKTSDAHTPEVTEKAPTPSLENPEREPSALEPPAAEFAAEPRVKLDAVATPKADAEAETDAEQLVKVSRIEAPAEPEAAAREAAGSLDVSRADVPAPAREAESDTPRAALQQPDRVARVEAPDVEVAHAAKVRAESAARSAEVELATVELELNALRETVSHAAEPAEPMFARRAELAVEEPRRASAEPRLRSVETPAAPTQAGMAVPGAMQAELPERARRDAPVLPGGADTKARSVLTDILPLVDRAATIAAELPAFESGAPLPSPADISIARRPSAAAAAVEAPGPASRPEFVTGSVSTPDATLSAARPAPTRRTADMPRVSEGASAAVARRTEAVLEAAPSSRIPLASGGAAGETATADAVRAESPRDLAAVRIDNETFRERDFGARPAASIALPARRAAPTGESRKLVNEQPRVDYRATPRAVAEGALARGAGVGADIGETAPVVALSGPQALVAAVAQQEGATGEMARVAASIEVARAQSARGTAATDVGPARPAAPQIQGQAVDYDARSMVGGALRTGMGMAGAATPAVPDAGTAAAGAASVDFAQARIVVGRVQGEVGGAGTAPDETNLARARVRGAAADGAAMDVSRAAAGGMAAPAVGGVRPEAALKGVGDDRAGRTTTLADAETGAVVVARVRGPVEVGAPGRAGLVEGGNALSLPFAAAASVERTAAGTEEKAREGTGTSGPRAAEFGRVGRASVGTEDETSASAVPLRGWTAPPLPSERGSAVRLSLDAGAVAGRSVDASLAGDADATPAARVQGMMVDDMARGVAAASKKAIYELRSPEKRRFIEELGGSPETEEAVEQALVWLAKAQSDDGRWDVDGFKGVEICGGAGDRVDGDVAVTGLSLLAYLGAGYTHTAGKHRDTVRKGLEWLIEGQGSDGDLRRGGTMYDQAMAAAALCESSSLTGDERLAVPARLAAEFIMAAQNPGAGWRYHPRNDNDTSVLGWQVLALKSAEISGVTVPPRHYAWTGQWLNQVRKGDGGLYAYKPGHGPTPVMTAEGWFCQLFMGAEERMQGQDESVAYLLENLPEWSRDKRGAIDLYYWYYATLAMQLSGVPEFQTWNNALKSALLDGRCREGPAAGSWDPLCQLGPRGGRVYSTAMAALCLEVYYRYLPFYRRMPTEP